MDLRCDNLTLDDTGLPGGAAIDNAASAVKNVFVGIRNRAKAKKAQAISDAGGYNTLTPFQKSLIPVPAYALNSSQTTAQEALDAEPEMNIKRYIPYALGAVVVGFIIFLIVRK